MTRYAIQKASPTPAVAIVLAGIASTIPHGLPPIKQIDPSVKIGECSQTGGLLSKLTAGVSHAQIVDFDDQISSFYANMLAQQEPLGAEFERVLFDNLWDLYVRD